MEDDWKKELIKLIASTRGSKETEALLQALLTPAEYAELAKRWQIVKQLIRGVPQRKVRDKLKASIATVTRGSRELKYGNGVFQKFYKRLQGR
ncbi:MAG: transcriptional regulator [Deltaproteobacteria bacterium]|nr:transcriptional regulator [Deltaproteobacteria bacterium]